MVYLKSRKFRAIPHNSKCRYGERGAADAKPKAQIILESYRAFWQRRCRAAAAGAVLKPSGGNCAVLPKVLSYHYIVVYPSCASSHESAWGVSEKSKLSSISTNTAGFCVKKPWNPQRIPAAFCLKFASCLRNIRHFLCFQIHLITLIPNMGIPLPRTEGTVRGNGTATFGLQMYRCFYHSKQPPP